MPVFEYRLASRSEFVMLRDCNPCFAMECKTSEK